MSKIFGLDSGYWLYMAEQNGMLDTRESKINRLILAFQRYYRQGYDINNEAFQNKVCMQEAGMTLADLTDKEKDRIARAIK